MPDPILFDSKPYHHHSLLASAAGVTSPFEHSAEDRQSILNRRKSLFKKKAKVAELSDTSGAYVRLGEADLLLIVDRNSVPYRSKEWDMIAATAAHLEASHAALSAQAHKALAKLRAVIFSAKPARSYADVKPNLFFYDTDEFRRKDGSLVGPAWAASCIIHDANHVWQYLNGKTWHGVKSEVECWQLQVDNAGALGLSDGEVAHLKDFIANPEKIVARAKSKVR